MPAAPVATVSLAELTATLHTARELLLIVDALATAAAPVAPPVLCSSARGMADALATRLVRLHNPETLTKP